MTGRPKRKAIPKRIQIAVAASQGGVCKCGCGTLIVWEGRKCSVQWDHNPALRLRDVAPDGRDYIPPQLDPDYIDGRCRPSHKVKTSGTGATIAGTDLGKIVKERKRNRKPRFKKAWPKGRKLKGRSRWQQKHTRSLGLKAGPGRLSRKGRRLAGSTRPSTKPART